MRNSPEAPPVDGGEQRVVYVTPRRGMLSTALQAVMLLLLLAILAGTLLMLFAVASLMNVPGQVAGGVGDRLGGAATEASRAVSGAQQAIQNVTDPNRPPTGLTYDAEFSALNVVRIGEHFPGGNEYGLSLQSIRRREGAESPDTAQYATIRAELRQPRETRLLGQLVRTDSDPHDHVVYKGESFRIGSAIYRVNWISDAERAIAVAAYRSPDSVTATVKFSYE
jgi:hypothetical protein